MLNKEYPYNGRGEYQMLKEIESNKKLKCCDNEKLNDLINKMLKVNINERISWDEYFNHPFFNQEKDNIQLFKFNNIFIFNSILYICCIKC